MPRELTQSGGRRRAPIAALLVAVVAAVSLAAQTAVRPATPAPTLETKGAVARDSVRFAVLGDTGTGARPQYEVADVLARSHDVFPFEFVVMLGDNIYGSERPQDFVKKFEDPYKALLDKKISFYAALGNHDDPNQRFYKPFNMNGQRFYTFQKNNVRFFVLDSNYMDKDQQAWLDKELAASTSTWKIAYMHHPLYSSGAQHGSEVDLREIVEPLFLKYGVSVALAGHEHFYERVKPQKGIQYFTQGGSAKLREGNIRRGAMTAVGFDTDSSFTLIEIDKDDLYFQTLSRRGALVDSGTFRVRPKSTQ